MTARYNAYFLAKERMKIVDEKLWKTQVDDYNRLLELFPLVDTNFSKTIKADLDYIFERASIPPTKHKNSKWVDDSYILIGKIKLYECKYDSATFAFKYVNTKSKDDQARFVALSWLIRTYLLNGEDRFAKDVHTYLEAQKLNNFSKKEFYLASAQYHRTRGDYPAMLEQVKKAIPLVKWDSDYRSRLHYIAGQLHQKLHQPDSAYYHYSMTLKKNPPYDLSFFAKLNMSQVSNPTEESEIRKIRKYFSKMLVDAKNEEFRDRIYYDMAQFELKQNQIDTAISLLNASLRVEGGVTPYMDAYAYLSLGKVHYTHPKMENLKKYTLAKLYYDSTVATMDTLFEGYSEIITRREVLENFVKQIETIEREDSLQRLAKMDETTLSAFLDGVKVKEEERLKEEARLELERKKSKKNTSSAGGNSAFFDPNNPTISGFTFYDPSKATSSSIKFKSIWGDRKLEDNWRRSSKEVAFTETVVEQDTAQIDSLTQIQQDSLTQLAKADSIKASIEKITVNKEDLYKNIPSTPEAIAASNDSLKKAFYLLGKIYDQDLEETENAIATFQELQNRFPGHDNYEEVYYFLYILCAKSESCNSDDYKNILLNKHPNSMYAKVILDPDYITDTKLANRTVHKLYEKAYMYYEKAQYVMAYNEVNNIISTYPHNDIMDKLEFLRILTYAKTDRIAKYKSALPIFIENNKDSKLIPFAEELLKDLNEKGPNLIIESDTVFRQPAETSTHFFIAFFNIEDIDYQENIKIFDEFKNTYYRDSTYTTRRIDFDTTQYLIVVKTFNNAKTVDQYHKKLVHWNTFSEHYKGLSYDYFVIDEKNYALLLKRRDKEAYKTFYKSAYR